MKSGPINAGTIAAGMLCAAIAHAEEITAGDIKIKGARMAKTELESTLKGSTVRYNSSSNGQPTQYVLNADGTYVGTTTTRNDRPSKAGTQGTWKLAMTANSAGRRKPRGRATTTAGRSAKSATNTITSVKATG